MMKRKQVRSVRIHRYKYGVPALKYDVSTQKYRTFRTCRRNTDLTAEFFGSPLSQHLCGRAEGVRMLT